jgi:hypothetical protein
MTATAIGSYSPSVPDASTGTATPAPRAGPASQFGDERGKVGHPDVDAELAEQGRGLAAMMGLVVEHVAQYQAARLGVGFAALLT